MKELQLRNRQRDRTVDLRGLRSVTVWLLEELLGLTRYEIAIHLVSARASAQLNEQFLQHSGPTDVITFDLREGYDPGATALEIAGEIYICIRIAEKQAEEFGTSWPAEMVRYVTHGILHLQGYDDLVPAKRAVMKREENRLMKALERQFELDQLVR